MPLPQDTHSTGTTLSSARAKEGGASFGSGVTSWGTSRATDDDNSDETSVESGGSEGERGDVKQVKDFGRGCFMIVRKPRQC